MIMVNVSVNYLVEPQQQDSSSSEDEMVSHYMSMIIIIHSLVDVEYYSHCKCVMHQ